MSGDRYPVTDQRAWYFLTITVVGWVDVFICPVYKQIITDSLNFCVENKKLTVFGWCLMTNHLHLIAEAKDYLYSSARDYCGRKGLVKIELL